MFKDSLKSIRGDFKIEAIQNGVVVDSEEDHNMIMDLGRDSVAGLLSGISTTSINKVVFGTLGYVEDISTPIPDGANGFISSRTNLFSEDSVGAYTYPIEFTPSGNASYAINLGSAGVDGCTVKVTTISNIATYEVTLGLQAGNGTDSLGTNFTEAAFYVGSNIFAMKTFASKFKDSSTTLRVTWSFTF